MKRLEPDIILPPIDSPSLHLSDGALYFGQFLLGPKAETYIPDWPCWMIDSDRNLIAHPDVACVQATQGILSLTLLGHILDPLSPSDDNRKILERLLHLYSDRSALIEGTSGFGGRWMIIATNGKESFLFHDALGLRQAHYLDPAVKGEIWVMSQPGMAADLLGQVLEPAASAFMESDVFRTNPEYRWPGDAAPLKGLRRLLPNHWLDLNTGIAHRYWPNRELTAIGVDAALERLRPLLTGIIEAATNRFDLALGLTAGLDSRLVLAAAKPVKDRISYITVRQSKMRDNHADVTLPGRLLERRGLKHEVIFAKVSMTPQFSHAFKQAVYLAHDHYGADAEAIFHRFGRCKSVLTGSGAEVGRCSFREWLSHAEQHALTPSLLAKLQGMEGDPFALNHFERWLTDAHDHHNINLLDLFEWEQGHGSWLATTQLEFNIAWREIFTPYNCREVLTTMLSVNEEYRLPPNYALFTTLIESLWPDLLIEPINPHIQKKQKSTKSIIKGWLRSSLSRH